MRNPYFGRDAAESVGNVKAKIIEVVCIPPDPRCLLFAGGRIPDARFLSYCRIRQQSTIHYVQHQSSGP